MSCKDRQMSHKTKFYHFKFPFTLGFLMITLSGSYIRRITLIDSNAELKKHKRESRAEKPC